MDETSRVAELVYLVQRTTGLDEGQAKTVVYYAVATHGLTKLDIFPVLAVYGSYGTGKTTLLGILKELAYEAYMMDGKVTQAAFRDALHMERTALIDEADDIPEPLLVNRYSRNTGQLTVKRQHRDGWGQEALKTFGATVLHRRIPFCDPAILSRAIVIATRRQPNVEPYDAERFRRFQDTVMELAAAIPWEDVKASHGNRIDDTWAPVRTVGEYLEDVEWLAFANAQIEKAKADLVTGQSEEPTHAVYQALLTIALAGYGGKPAERVLVSEVRDATRNMIDQRREINSWQIGNMLRDMGFHTRRVGGSQYVYTGGKEKLARIGAALGIQDEWIDGILAAEGMKV